jgi:hypothetical protein
MIIVPETQIHNAETAHAGIKEWLQASRNMIISAYVGDLATMPLMPDDENEEPIFGLHLREAADAIARLLN